MILKNATVITESFLPEVCDIEIIGEKIERVGKGLSGECEIDLSGKTVFPGFIDLHIHGGIGIQIDDEEPDLKKLRLFEATQGVTGIAMSTACTEWDNILHQCDITVESAKENVGTRILGIHSEAPFLSKKAKGAIPEYSIIPPDIEKFDELLIRCKGLLKIITVAPEESGATELIRHAKERGVAVSIGHTVATYEEAISGIEAGATHATHTFNAMTGLHHRNPGAVGAVLTDRRVRCEAICDYVHLHPATVKLIYKMKGADGMIAVSDSVKPAGLDITEYIAEGRRCTVADGVIRLPDGTINGSTRTLLDGARNLIKAKIPLGDVAKITSYNAACELGVEDMLGSIKRGKYADLAILDEELNLYATYIGGECVYKRGESE